MCDCERNIPTCESCEDVARVRVLEGYVDGEPVVRQYCLRCARDAAPSPPRPQVGRRRLGIPVLVGLAGVGLGIVGVFGDACIPDARQGFGLFQQGGVALGALIVFIGALLRTDVIALGGMFIFVASLSADWFGLARSPGIGQKQQIVLWASAACMAFAVLGSLATPRVLWRILRCVRRGCSTEKCIET